MIPGQVQALCLRPAWPLGLITDGEPARQHAGDSQALFYVGGPL